MLRKVFQRLRQIVKTNMASALEGKTEGKRSGEETENDICKKQKTETYAGRSERKRKVALLIAYNGKGYYGLQLNPGFPSIEGDIIRALLEAGLITQDHHDMPRKMSFQRAARTDKGVSAAGNLLSLKMLLNKDNLLEEINKHLPPQIRVFECVRTTNGFNSKTHCSGRTYIYVLPTFSFAPVEEMCTLDYRTNADIIERANEVLAKFEGTHNFHNFTSGIKPTEHCAKRYILGFECRMPFVRDGVEFCVLAVHGQSFMMHQIRKMVGLTISIMRGYANIDAIEEAWKHEKMDIPKAPALGLMLDKLHYDQYNKRWASDGSHERIDFIHLKEKLDKFKEEYIFSEIIKEEIETNSMMNWMSNLHKHTCTTMEDRWADRENNEKVLDTTSTETKDISENTDMAETETANIDELDQTERQSSNTSDCKSGTNPEEKSTNQDQSCDNVTSSNMTNCDSGNLTNQKELCGDVTPLQENCDSENNEENSNKDGQYSEGDSEVRAESIR